jgi:hypothetical protein
MRSTAGEHDGKPRDDPTRACEVGFSVTSQPGGSIGELPKIPFSGNLLGIKWIECSLLCLTS